MENQTKRILCRYKGDRCCSCGRTVQEVFDQYQTIKRLFNFHHSKPEEKAENYDNLVRRQISEEVLDEIDKCVLLCSGCHDVVEAQNIKATVKITITAGSRTFQQIVQGHIIRDFRDNHDTFITNERLLVFPFWIQRKGEDGILTNGQELDNGLYIRFLRKLELGNQLAVRTFRDLKIIAIFTRISEDEIQVEHLFEFSFLSIADENNDAWFRNGYLITKDGQVAHKGSSRFVMLLSLDASV